VNIKRLAQAANTIAVGWAELAEALNDSAVAAPAGPGAVSSPPTAPATFNDGTPIDEPQKEEWTEFAPAPTRAAQPSLADESTDFAPSGGLEVCPAHHREYKEGTYGPYCSAKGDDPAWTNKRGYCTITPKNAAQYLRVKAAA
jgi:hypothetical protein